MYKHILSGSTKNISKCFGLYGQRYHIRQNQIMLNHCFDFSPLFSISRSVSSIFNRDLDYETKYINEKCFQNEMQQSKLQCDELYTAPETLLTTLKAMKSLQNITLNDGISFVNVIMLSLYNEAESISNLKDDPFLFEFFQQFEPFINELSSEDLVYTLIASNKTGIPLHHSITTKIFDEISTRLKTGLNEVSLLALSNFVIFAFDQRYNIYPYFLCTDAIPHILRHLEKCNNLQELYYVTLCLSKISKIITEDTLALYKEKVESILINSNIEFDFNYTLRISKLLYYSKVIPNRTTAIRQILIKFTDHLPKLTDAQLADLLYIQEIILEPASIVPEIVKISEMRLKQRSNLDLLHCFSRSALPENQEKVHQELKTEIEMSRGNNILNGRLFEILGNINSSNSEILVKYWEKVTDNLATHKENDVSNALTRICKRYFHFDVRGSYRYLPFESAATALIENEIKFGISGLVPNKLAKLSTFLIGYGVNHLDRSNNLPEVFVQKIEEMAPQFTIQDSLQISRGLEIFYSRQSKNNKENQSHLSSQLCRIENALDECIERHLKLPLIGIQNLSHLVHAYSIRRNAEVTAIYAKVIRKLEFELACKNITLSSLSIRDITNFNITKYIVPKLCEEMLCYVHANRNVVSGEIVCRVFNSLFQLGYEPNSHIFLLKENTNSDSVNIHVNFEDFGKIIERDFDVLPALVIVRACLALTFYRALPISLLNRVFALNFIRRFEQELSLRSTEKHYRKYGLYNIMELNRAVCFEYPESGVVWFLQKYVEANFTSEVSRKLIYHEDILSTLHSTLRDRSLIQINHVTPYGYKIPFVLYFDSNKNIVTPPVEDKTLSLNKLAIIPLQNSAYCNSNNNKRYLRGRHVLRQRHLEMLGFNVVQIPYDDWHSLHMNLSGAKEIYLKGILKL